MKNKSAVIILMLLAGVASGQQNTTVYRELYRPQIHFSPKQHWMNDPNGMVYFKNTWHLFFQYYPDSTVWGPMHWGHATSIDLIHWKEKPIALFPDELGYIFSGSIVADIHNTSGLGINGTVPLVAIYTSHDPKGEKAGKNNFQVQSLAYSLDEGNTWSKYRDNPIVKNPGITDFRDPKISWHNESKKWIMTLATKDRVTFYASPDLKQWKKESEFGGETGAHGGVWECPDLFKVGYNGKSIWVLLVSINPGGPNGGSATQYFTGNFDGKTFTADDTTTKWLDYGTDNYAGVTWSNTGNRKIFLGWMSNWNYATSVPTVTWRSAMTVPRELHIRKVNNTHYLTSTPANELNKIVRPAQKLADTTSTDITIPGKKIANAAAYRLHALIGSDRDFSITFSNSNNEKIVAGYDKNSNTFYLDRSNAGVADFNKSFAAKHTAPRFAGSKYIDVSIIIDKTSIEFFADEGLSVMTDIFFPKSLLNHVRIQAPATITLKKVQLTPFESIWRKH